MGFFLGVGIASIMSQIAATSMLDLDASDVFVCPTSHLTNPIHRVL